MQDADFSYLALCPIDPNSKRDEVDHACRFLGRLMHPGLIAMRCPQSETRIVHHVGKLAPPSSSSARDSLAYIQDASPSLSSF